MKKKTLNFIFLLSLIGFSLAFAFLILAQEERKLEVEYPKILGLKPETVRTLLPEYIKYVFNFAIILAGFIVFAALVLGGFVYLTAAGNPNKLKEGKDRITSAFLGIIILLSSYIILTNINPQLVIFPLPLLTPREKVEVPPPRPMGGEEVSLIVTEIPLGQAVENGIWNKKNRKETGDLMGENERALTARVQTDDGGKFEEKLISDLNKYLESLTKECHCEELTDLCTKPKECGKSITCTGDPCPEKIRKKINWALISNEGEIKEILEIQKKILEKKTIFEEKLSKLQDIEQEILSCETQTKLLFDLNEHLSRMNFYRQQGWKLETIKIPGAPDPKGDAITFYCSTGGTIFDYPYTLKQEIPAELTTPGMTITELPAELTTLKAASCPVEIPVGDVVDELRELVVLLIIKLEKLANLEGGKSEKLGYLESEELSNFEGGLPFQLNKMEEWVSQCNDKNCQTDCGCVPNIPCGMACALPGPGAQILCLIPCFPTPFVCIPNPCYMKCSPCAQVVGGCECKDKTNCPCPKVKIEETVKKIKRIEDEIFKTTREINGILGRASSLLGEDREIPWNLKTVREGMRYCYSSEMEEPTWGLMDCETAIGNYGPTGQLIGDCHPRNFFCCSVSAAEIKFPWTAPPQKEPVFTIPAEKYQPLPEENGCPKGWLCDSDVKAYNQYKDASEPLKEFLSCMRIRLDKTKQEKGLKTTIGRISSISDSALYIGACNWETGPTQPGGFCSHTYEVKYGKERVSAHYGGPACRYQKKSYAVDLGDEENADYIIAAAKECRPDTYFLRESDHIHFSISQGEGCGAN